MKASKGERKIYDILSMNGFDFKEEYSFPDLVASSGRVLRFDFVVFDENGDIDFLIEYQGEQHYEARSKFGGAQALYQQKFNDQKKKNYCKLHGYTLICIPYWDLQIIDYDYIVRAAYGQ